MEVNHERINDIEAVHGLSGHSTEDTLQVDQRKKNPISESGKSVQIQTRADRCLVRERNGELMMRVREGSLADRYIKACNWIDNTKVGNALGMVLMSIMTVGLLLYGVWNYPL